MKITRCWDCPATCSTSLSVSMYLRLPTGTPLRSWHYTMQLRLELYLGQIQLRHLVQLAMQQQGWPQASYSLQQWRTRFILSEFNQAFHLGGFQHTEIYLWRLHITMDESPFRKSHCILPWKNLSFALTLGYFTTLSLKIADLLFKTKMWWHQYVFYIYVVNFIDLLDCKPCDLLDCKPCAFPSDDAQGKLDCRTCSISHPAA